MSYIPPPPPLSKKEFEKRIAEGARSIEEIDPELYKWKKQCDFSHRVYFVILLFGIVLLAIAFLNILSKS